MIAASPDVNLRLAQDFDAAAELVALRPCIGAAALDADGHIVAATSPKAVCWCPQGAAMKVTRFHPDGDDRHWEIMEALHFELGDYMAISVWADTHPWDEVVGLCRRAAQRARGIEP